MNKRLLRFLFETLEKNNSLLFLLLHCLTSSNFRSKFSFLAALDQGRHLKQKPETLEILAKVPCTSKYVTGA